MTEQLELLGKGLYDDIPDVLTLSSMPTVTELDVVSSEDFDATMLDDVLPKCVKEPINFRKLLEIDYHWICRALRILNYGPYFTTNTLFCETCNEVHKGEYRVNLNTVPCVPLPAGFKNDIVIKKGEFLEFNEDIHLKLLTIEQVLNAHKDSMFKTKKGLINREFARLCYMISSIGSKTAMNPVEVKNILQNEMSNADFMIFKESAKPLTDYGLSASGTAVCPVCGDKESRFIALIDDRFFRPSLGDLREWRGSRSSGEKDDISRSATKAVRRDN